MNVKQAYHKYKVPQNLQKHMLRVAAIAEIITSSWLGNNINKNTIILACLFHDVSTMTGLFIHIMPPMVMYTFMWKGEFF